MSLEDVMRFLHKQQLSDALASSLSAQGNVLSEESWRAWTPSSRQPLRLRGAEQAQCATGGMNLHHRRGNYTRILQRMCLIPGNTLISRRIRHFGRWDDCAPLRRLWREEERSYCAEQALVEIGGNIGACTLEMLLSTSAKLVVFEPSPMNLFHLTSTLLYASAAATGRKGAPTPSARIGVDVGVGLPGRVVVYPLGASAAPGTASLFADLENSGNSVVGTMALSSRKVRRFNVTLRPLDALFPAHARLCVPLVKLDAQGFECAVLRGMGGMLGGGRVRAISAELWPHGLVKQGCSEEGLLALLRSHAYALTYSWASAGAECRNATAREAAASCMTTLVATKRP